MVGGTTQYDVNNFFQNKSTIKTQMIHFIFMQKLLIKTVKTSCYETFFFDNY